MQQFDMSEELADQIRFAMENQEQLFVLDSMNSCLVDASAIENDPERYLPLPSWTSMDGFNLMESFTATLRNPIMRNELYHILQSGRGVFRSFKDALRMRPEIERLWFRFKDKAMRRRVFEWYNDCRELWGLERLAVEQEVATDELVDADFDIGPPDPAAAAVLVPLDAEALDEMFASWPEAERSWIVSRYRPGTWSPADGSPLNEILAARSAAGDIAGFAWARLDQPGPDTLQAQVVMMYVVPEFRGLGLGRTLYRRLKARCLARGCTRIIMSVPESSQWLLRHLEQDGFSLLQATMQLEL